MADVTISGAGAHGSAEATDRVPASKSGTKGYLTLLQILGYVEANIEAGGGEMTAEEILAALLTIDGASSGLDADLLDGNHASAFALSGHNHTGTYQPLDADLTSIAGLSTTAGGRALLTLSDPNADRILFWDDSAGAYTHLTVGTGLSITDTTIEATGGGGGMGSLVEDTSPQLGGDLDLNGHVITGMVIGTHIQAYDADLAAIAALSPSNDDIVQRKAGAWTNRTMAQLIADLAALGTTFQPLDSDLTAIAALTTTAAGLTSLTFADPNADRILAWDDSAGAVAPIALADIATEAAPAAGDYLLAYTDAGALVKINWSSLPSGSGSPGGSSGQLQYNNSSSFGGSLLWQSTNTIEQYDSTNAQSLWIYNTRTDSSNYERAGVRWNSNVLEIGTFKLGTGSGRDVNLMRDGVAILTIGASGATGLTTSSGFWSTNRIGVGTSGSEGIQFLLTGSDICRFLNASGGGAAISFAEMSGDPSAPSTNVGVLYFKDNGSGKTQACIRFATGAVQVIATEP